MTKTTAMILSWALLILPATVSAESGKNPRPIITGKGRSSMQGYGNIDVRWKLVRGRQGDRLVIRREVLHPGEFHERFSGTVPKADRYGSALLQHPDHSPIHVTRRAVRSKQAGARSIQYSVTKPGGRFTGSEVHSALAQFAGKLKVASQTTRVGAFTGEGQFLSGGYRRGARWSFSGNTFRIEVEPKYRGERINSTGTYAIGLPGGTTSGQLVNVTAARVRSRFVYSIDFGGMTPSAEQLRGLVEKFAGLPSAR